MPQRTRRTILNSIATVSSLTLAGCNSTSSTSANFETVTTEGTSLVITLDTSDGVDKLTVIDPDGEAFQTLDTTAGQTKYTIDIGTAYTPGKYELNIVTDNEVKATTSIELRPELSITGLGIGANHKERMPDSLGNTKDVECIVDLANKGSGPSAIQKLSFAGDVPNPTEKGENSGIYDANSGGGEVAKVVIDSNEQTTIYSSTLPFTFEGNGVDCETDSKNGDVKVILNTSNISTVTTNFEVRYPGSDSYNGCNPEIVGRK